MAANEKQKAIKKLSQKQAQAPLSSEPQLTTKKLRFFIAFFASVVMKPGVLPRRRP
jgi:hypothetical protein